MSNDGTIIHFIMYGISFRSVPFRVIFLLCRVILFAFCVVLHLCIRSPPLSLSLSMRVNSKYFAGIKHVYWIFVYTVLTSSTSEIGALPLRTCSFSCVCVCEFYLYWFNDFHEFSPSNHYSHEMLAMYTNKTHACDTHCLLYERCVVSGFPFTCVCWRIRSNSICIRKSYTFAIFTCFFFFNNRRNILGCSYFDTANHIHYLSSHEIDYCYFFCQHRNSSHVI